MCALRQATGNERRVLFGYVDGEDRSTIRAVAPLSIIYGKPRMCCWRGAICAVFSECSGLGRMQALEVLDISFRPRCVPMLRECLTQMTG